jgi:branched-chain amino acid transport system substrate-binding protein
MIQFRGVADKNVEQFRQAGKQVILYPSNYKNGEVIPFDKAQK